MHRRIARFVSTQKHCISRPTAVNHHEMVLYNEKPQKSKSLILYVDDANDKGVIDSYEFKTIRSNNSRIMFLLNKKLIVLYKGSYENNIPILEVVASINEIPTIGLIDLLRWFVNSKDSDVKSPVQSGGRLGTANEAGFFHRTERTRLKEIKKKLKAKDEENPTESKKTD